MTQPTFCSLDVVVLLAYAFLNSQLNGYGAIDSMPEPGPPKHDSCRNVRRRCSYRPLLHAKNYGYLIGANMKRPITRPGQFNTNLFERQF
jgi:hypothetical protein